MWRRHWKWIVGLILVLLMTTARMGAEERGEELTGLLPFLLTHTGNILLVIGIFESLHRWWRERQREVPPYPAPPPPPPD